MTIQELQELKSKATPAPWHTYTRIYGFKEVQSDVCRLICEAQDDDAIFLSYAHDIADLAIQLHSENEKLKEELRMMKGSAYNR